MKKVLIIGGKYFGYSYSIERAFISLGWQTKTYEYTYACSSNTDYFNYNINQGKYLLEKRKQHIKNSIKYYDEFQPDLVFFLQDGDLDFNAISHMKKTKKVMWLMDTLHRAPRNFSNWEVIEHIYSYEKTEIEVFWNELKKNIKFLPLALDESIYFPIANMKKDIDLFFVGSLFDFRMQMINQIALKYPEKNIKAYGKFFSKYRKPLYSLFRSNKKLYPNQLLDPKEVNIKYNQSLISLNTIHPQNKYGVNQRFFEISGSKAFQLVNENEFIKDHFNSSEIITYSNTNNLFEILDEVLNFKIDINSISQNAYINTIKNHTFKHRIIQILKEIK